VKTHSKPRGEIQQVAYCLRTFIAFAIVIALCPACFAVGQSFQDLIDQGIEFRQKGELLQSMDVLFKALSASKATHQQIAETALGETLLQAGRLEEAERFLQAAYDAAEPTDRPRPALLLGNLAIRRHQDEKARRFFEEAASKANNTTEIEFSARLNLIRVTRASQRLSALEGLSREFLAQGDDTVPGRYHLNLGSQAARLGKAALMLSYRHLEAARAWAVAHDDQLLLIESMDMQAQLYEDNGRTSDALVLVRNALKLIGQQEAVPAGYLIINLEWRQARLIQAEGKPDASLAAYTRAVARMEEIKQDIPIEYDDGRSSYRTTLEPLYLGYLDSLLRSLDQRPFEAQEAGLRQAIETVEAIRQAELQDFLGDSCSVEAAQGAADRRLAPGTAVLYPISLPDRVELLLETNSGIVRATGAVKASELQIAAAILAEGLRYGIDSYREPSRQLYDWLLRPLGAALAEQNIRNLVVVPNGQLRLVPFAVLSDGKQYFIEQMAVSTVTGISMTKIGAPPTNDMSALLAGLSKPGTVVNKLDGALASLIVQTEIPRGVVRGLAFNGKVRTMRSLPVRSELAGADGSATRIAELGAQLMLPGVKEEIDTLGALLKGRVLLDSQFTAGRFRNEAESGSYRVVHVASHGIFGGSAETSFLLAHDDILTMNNLQSVLKAEQIQKRPIELLSLSACETAEGNDRAPLGISGAAMKARAKSVLGTLWAVNDTAAKSMMIKTYQGIARDKLSKTEALRQAQISLLKSPDFSHPFFWAPFVLIGNWQ
jgi:CHAT domain-containing protein